MSLPPVVDEAIAQSLRIEALEKELRDARWRSFAKLPKFVKVTVALLLCLPVVVNLAAIIAGPLAIVIFTAAAIFGQFPWANVTTVIGFELLTVIAAIILIPVSWARNALIKRGEAAKAAREVPTENV